MSGALSMVKANPGAPRPFPGSGGALDQVSACAVLVARLRAGYELTDWEAGRMVSGRTLEDWLALKALRRQRFTGKANLMLARISGKLAIYDVAELRTCEDGRSRLLTVWRYVGGTADMEYMEQLAPREIRGRIPKEEA